jgi:hypothetical protein
MPRMMTWFITVHHATPSPFTTRGTAAAWGADPLEAHYRARLNRAADH